MMDQAIKNFAEQFSYQPAIEHSDQLEKRDKFVVCGMGGSHLAADILQSIAPAIDLLIHREYGLPAIDLADRLVIASSYSGNTEEVIDALETAMAKKLSIAVVAVGGKLIELAKAKKLPYVQMPDTGIQPRSALGLSFRALLKIIGQDDLLGQSNALATKLDPAGLEKQGKQLAQELTGQVPIIYTSQRNMAIAYNWKIKLNETGKIPAFYNVVPELNHNEMTGFDVADSSRSLSEKFHFVFLPDRDDHPRVQKRMTVLQSLLEERQLPVTAVPLTGGNQLEKVFSSLLIADWFAFYTAQRYGLEAEQVPMIEDFKKKIAS